MKINSVSLIFTYFENFHVIIVVISEIRDHIANILYLQFLKKLNCKLKNIYILNLWLSAYISPNKQAFLLYTRLKEWVNYSVHFLKNNLLQRVFFLIEGYFLR